MAGTRPAPWAVCARNEAIVTTRADDRPPYDPERILWPTGTYAEAFGRAGPSAGAS
jgi:hypothetical protein